MHIKLWFWNYLIDDHPVELACEELEVRETQLSEALDHVATRGISAPELSDIEKPDEELKNWC